METGTYFLKDNVVSASHSGLKNRFNDQRFIQTPILCVDKTKTIDQGYVQNVGDACPSFSERSVLTRVGSSQNHFQRNWALAHGHGLTNTNVHPAVNPGINLPNYSHPSFELPDLTVVKQERSREVVNVGEFRLRDRELNGGPLDYGTQQLNTGDPQTWYFTTGSEHLGMNEVHQAVCGFLAGTSNDDKPVVKREHIAYEPPIVTSEISNILHFQAMNKYGIQNDESRVMNMSSFNLRSANFNKDLYDQGQNNIVYNERFAQRLGCHNVPQRYTYSFYAGDTMACDFPLRDGMNLRSNFYLEANNTVNCTKNNESTLVNNRFAPNCSSQVVSRPTNSSPREGSKNIVGCVPIPNVISQGVLHTNNTVNCTKNNVSTLVNNRFAPDCSSQVVSTNCIPREVTKNIVGCVPIPNVYSQKVPLTNINNHGIMDPSLWMKNQIAMSEIDNSLLEKHFEGNGLDNYKCNMCPEKLYHRLDRIRDHVRRHLGIKPFRCRFKDCKESFSSTSTFRSHAQRHFSTEIQCEHCPKRFLGLHVWRDHQNVHTDKKPHKCKECNKHFHTHVDCQYHARRMHGDLKTKKLCEICGQIMAASAFVSHVKSVHKNPLSQSPHKCTICRKTFTNKIRFDRHVHGHGGDINEQYYTCDTCSKTYKNRKIFVRHFRRHTLTHMYECPKCNKTFKDKTFFQGHLRQHDGIKKYSCRVCGKTFTHRHYLDTHMKSHGEKNFVCATCGGKFNRKDNLKSHIIRQHLSSKKKKLKRKV